MAMYSWGSNTFFQLDPRISANADGTVSNFVQVCPAVLAGCCASYVAENDWARCMC